MLYKLDYNNFSYRMIQNRGSGQIIVWNFAVPLLCLNFGNIIQILPRNILPFFFKHFQCKANVFRNMDVNWKYYKIKADI